MSCPRCRSESTLKRGYRTSLGCRIFYCRNCKRRFSERTSSPYNQRGFLSAVSVVFGAIEREPNQDTGGLTFTKTAKTLRRGRRTISKVPTGRVHPAYEATFRASRLRNYTELDNEQDRSSTAIRERAVRATPLPPSTLPGFRGHLVAHRQID